MSKEEIIQGANKVRDQLSENASKEGVPIDSITWHPNPDEEAVDLMAENYFLIARTGNFEFRAEFAREWLEDHPAQDRTEVEERIKTIIEQMRR